MIKVADCGIVWLRGNGSGNRRGVLVGYDGRRVFDMLLILFYFWSEMGLLLVLPNTLTLKDINQTLHIQ